MMADWIRAPMHLDRRTLISTGLVSTGLAAANVAAAADAGPREGVSMLMPRDGADQTSELQAAIDVASARGMPLSLGPGRFRIGALELRPGTHLAGVAGRTVLEFAGGAAFVTAKSANGVRVERLVLDGNQLGIDAHRALGLLALEDCEGVSLSELEVRRSLINGIALAGVSGRVSNCALADMSQAGIFCLDARGLEIGHNVVTDCANNGIQVWRSAPGEDGTLVASNRVERIAAKGGGSGQNGNGINVFRAGGVVVSGNRIADCAYSAVRANAAGNVQIIGNSCARAGEVALYAEFGFEGALIANNLVDGAASGIAVTNFNDGGRLAVVSGNLVRNLFRREAEPVDKRGIGVSVEADAAVTGNVIEGAPTAGIVAGWQRYLRDVSITGNLVRTAGVGILVSSDSDAGACLISHNMISGAADGAIRVMDGDGVPKGPDLVAAEPPMPGRLAISGNLAS
jgi:uncharacterized secreted repeat protein (TIGR03808 family)